jgi:LruC domain-containing protein
VNDVIDASMISDINATLPEYIALPTSHPQYFAQDNNQNLVLTDPCNVWVTFVSEGAGYRNVLGYYKYNVNNPPTSVDQIDSIHIIFPNTSFSGSGGGLNAGNKVHIGQFPKGTAIGWVLIANGFDGSITNGSWIFYSDKQFNPETNPAIKQHFVLLNDIGRDKFLLSVEDIKRDAGSDNDFNDAVFYVSADPIQAVDASHLPLPNYKQVDSDGDGISDAFDDYPKDPAKAFNNYYPSEKSYGTLAFEDLWPSKGDYDFNDMVVDYHFNQITNGQNKVVKIEGKCVLRAMGAGFENGFGIQLPVSPDQVSAFTGSKITGTGISLLANGTESGQSKATLILFDNGYKILQHIAGSQTGVNTTLGDAYQTPDTLSVNITFASPVALSQLGVPPYNPFIFVDKDRTHEIHLINNPPTDKADISLFGTGQDDSNPASERYYVTKNNLPWALNTIDKFSYPAEKVPINEGFIKFIPWSVSGGSQYFDWFQDKSGYRNSDKLYH